MCQQLRNGQIVLHIIVQSFIQITIIVWQNTIWILNKNKSEVFFSFHKIMLAHSTVLYHFQLTGSMQKDSIYFFIQ